MPISSYSTNRDSNAGIPPGNISVPFSEFWAQQIVNSIRQLMADLAVDFAAGGVGAGVQTINTDADFTLSPTTSPFTTLHTGTLTAHRTVTLSTTGAFAGLRFRITRTGGGNFNLNVGSGPLKAMPTGTWAQFIYSGSAYYLAEYGSLDGSAVLG